MNCEKKQMREAESQICKVVNNGNTKDNTFYAF
jgi:hypothetical protein